MRNRTNKRIHLNRGGTSSSKTGSIIRLILSWLITGYIDDEVFFERWLVTIVRKYTSNLTRSVQRDFENAIEEAGLKNQIQVNKSARTYSYQGRQVEFIGIDDPQKARGPRRDILYCNEANELTYEDFQQLNMRTRYKVFIDFNPDDEDIWINTEIEQKRRTEVWDVELIVSTYKDNPFLSKEIIHEIEALRSNPIYWRVYGEWQYGKIEGLIFDFTDIEQVPPDAELLGYWLDFWYTNDPTALIAVYRYNNEIILDEIIYETGLTNTYKGQSDKDKSIVWQLENNGIERSMEIFADSAEPKSIEEIYKEGWNVKPVKKWPDSVLFWIQVMKGYKIRVTQRSHNLRKEFRNYSWAKDKNGNTLNKPVDNFNHWIDAVRYFAIMRLAKVFKKKTIRVL